MRTLRAKVWLPAVHGKMWTDEDAKEMEGERVEFDDCPAVLRDVRVVDGGAHMSVVYEYDPAERKR